MFKLIVFFCCFGIVAVQGYIGFPENDKDTAERYKGYVQIGGPEPNITDCYNKLYDDLYPKYLERYDGIEVRATMAASSTAALNCNIAAILPYRQ